MKRHPALQPLSDDHHRALVLGRRLRRADPAALAALAHEVRRAAEAELEPHFGVEERVLLPLLRAKGADALVARTEADHARVRELVRGAWSLDAARALGELLERHVRFEERELFPEAEALLSEAELATVRAATPNDPRRGRGST